MAENREEAYASSSPSENGVRERLRQLGDSDDDGGGRCGIGEGVLAADTTMMTHEFDSEWTSGAREKVNTAEDSATTKNGSGQHNLTRDEEDDSADSNPSEERGYELVDGVGNLAVKARAA